MMTEDMEAKLMKLSYIEMCHKKYYFSNQPFVKKVGQSIDHEQQAIASEFVRHMIDNYGLEEHAFLGTGHFEKYSHQIPVSDSFFTTDQYKESLKSNAFISPGSDIAIVRFHRYFDLTEIFESVNIYFVLNGVLNTTIANKSFSLEKGNIMILSPNIVQNVFIEDDDTVVLAIMIRSSSFVKNFHRILESGSSCADFFVKMFNDRENAPFSITSSPYDLYLKDILIRIIAMQYESSEFQNPMIRNLTEDFILYLFSHHYNNMVIYDNNVKANELVYNVIGYLYENYTNSTLDDVARKFSYSTKHISRLLYKVLGKKYQELITEIRLNKAQDLLSNTDLDIENICRLLGYSNPRHLRYLFSNTFGISPSKYRGKYSKARL